MKNKVNRKFNPKTGQIVVVGASAGGLDALIQLIKQLPEHFPAPVLIVMHISPDATGDVLLDALSKHGNLPCVHAVHGERAKPGYVYLAPSDHHLMIEGTGHLLVTKGPRRTGPALGLIRCFAPLPFLLETG